MRRRGYEGGMIVLYRWVYVMKDWWDLVLHGCYNIMRGVE
jgi:hypothetical protein